MPLADIIPHIQAMADELRRLHAEAEEFNHAMSVERMAREALQEEILNLKTVMIAAAEEIHEHWEAHCDAEGHGPVNLMRRLEQGIPSEYGYTAGTFATLKACVLEAQNAAIDLSGKNQALQDAIRRVLKARDRYGWSVEADVEIEAMRDQIDKKS